MNYSLLSQRWLQILIGLLVLSAIIIGSSQLLGFQIVSQRSLQILIGGLLFFAVVIGFSKLTKLKVMSQPWQQILFGGLLLSVFAAEVIRETGNIFFIPAVIVISSFLIPIVIVAYLYQHVLERDVSVPLLVVCFFIGGVLGFASAGFILNSASKLWTVPGFFGVGMAEESVKLILPVVIFVLGKYRHEADGLLFGVASGMGFASLETMGYALNSFIESGGALGPMQWVLLYRGALAPANHAAWTGFVCAILWRQRERTGKWVGLSPFGGFLVAMVLHALWNAVAYPYASLAISEQSPARLAASAFEFLAVAGAGVSLVLWRFHRSRYPPGKSVPESY